MYRYNSADPTAVILLVDGHSAAASIYYNIVFLVHFADPADFAPGRIPARPSAATVTSFRLAFGRVLPTIRRRRSHLHPCAVPGATRRATTTTDGSVSLIKLSRVQRAHPHRAKNFPDAGSRPTAGRYKLYLYIYIYSL